MIIMTQISHTRFIDLRNDNFNGFTKGGTRKVLLNINGFKVSLFERIETIPLTTDFAFRQHYLTVEGININNYSLEDKSLIISALREYDEMKSALKSKL